jgi:dihydrofolate reductase
MAKLVYALHQSLDGYVDHRELGPPGPVVFRHFIDHVRGLTGMVYGRRMYEIMRYWDDDRQGDDANDREFAAAWRSKPKWVVSRTWKSVSSQPIGPNARLVEDDLETAMRELKAHQVGEIDVAGPALAAGLTSLGLIDEYRLYLRPVVLGRGTPFFQGARPPLRLRASELIAEDMIKLTYVPA